MKNQTPQQVALRTAGNISIILGTCFLLLKIFLKTIFPWWLLGLLILLLFIVSYFSIITSLEKFIYRKIKVIYKKISDKKSMPTIKGRQQMDIQQDILSEVDEEVEDWLSKRNTEVEQLKREETFRKEFLGNVSHELKTPLTSIQGYIETLIDGALNDPKVNIDYLHKAQNNVFRLALIIDDLEQINSLEYDEIAFKQTEFDINLLSKEVIDDLSYQAKSFDISIRIKEGMDSKFMVFADREKIRQVLNNLVVNAIKYGNENGNTQIGFYDMADAILIEVSDDGVGIEEKDLPRLFERFYRVEKSRSRDRGGTGLGLAIVKHIIEAHGQTINVRSLPGAGSTFGFTLKKV